jgi:hypothetical protein
MSDEPTPEVRALVAKLFAAGRAERPGPALGRRLLLIEPPQARQGALAPRESAVSPERHVTIPAPSRVAAWVAAAAMVAGSAGLWLVLEPEPRSISISPDRAREQAGSTSSERLAEGPAPHIGLEATHGASGAEVVPRTDEVVPRADAERAAPPRRAASRARATEPKSQLDSAVPPMAAPLASESLAPAPPLKPMTLRAELDLLKRARVALRSGHGAQALELLTRHSGERTGNELDAEATLLRIEALAALGRYGDASELAARFVRDNPNSALGDRAKSFIRTSAPSP